MDGNDNDDGNTVMEDALVEMHANALKTGATKIEAERQSKLAEIEASIQGAKRIATFSPESTKTFSEFVNASLVAIKAAPLPEGAWPLSNQAANVFLAVTGRSHTLSRTKAEGAGGGGGGGASTTGAYTVPSGVHADDVAEGPKGIPRPPPNAAPVGTGNGIPDRLDVRALCMSSYSLNLAVYHATRAVQQQKAQSTRADGLYNPEIGGPQDKYLCTPEHVAWSLTEPYGPFRPCSEGEFCAGRTLMTLPEAHRVTLKMYVSPHVRAEYERTGVLPRVDEHNRKHIEECIICYLKHVTAVSALMAVTNQTSAPVFPDFYNPTGSAGTYHDSALTCFSTLTPTGSVMGYRNFLPDQLVASSSIHVVQTIRDPAGGHVAVSQLVKVRGLRERTDLVGWRPKIECDATQTVSLAEPPPPTAPSTRPPHAPNSSEASPSGVLLIPAPPELTDAAETLRKARAGMEHMFPRKPTPTLITFNKTSMEVNATTSRKRPAAAAAGGAAALPATPPPKQHQSRNVTIKTEPIEEPPVDSSPSGNRYDRLLAQIKAVTASPLLPKN